jgi:hypothetical protein
VLEDYDGRIAAVQQKNAPFQQKLFKGQMKFEKSLKKYWNANTLEVVKPALLQEALNNYTAEAYREYYKVIGW